MADVAHLTHKLCCDLSGFRVDRGSRRIHHAAAHANSSGPPSRDVHWPFTERPWLGTECHSIQIIPVHTPKTVENPPLP